MQHYKEDADGLCTRLGEPLVREGEDSSACTVENNPHSEDEDCKEDSLCLSISPTGNQSQGCQEVEVSSVSVQRAQGNGIHETSICNVTKSKAMDLHRISLERAHQQASCSLSPPTGSQRQTATIFESLTEDDEEYEDEDEYENEDEEDSDGQSDNSSIMSGCFSGPTSRRSSFSEGQSRNNTLEIEMPRPRLAMKSVRIQKKSRLLYDSAREIMTSEKSFLEVLKLINVDFKTFAEERLDGKKSNKLPKQEISVIFKNMPQMLTLSEEFLHDFEDRIKNWDSEPKIADIFVKKGPYLRIHKTYIDAYDNMSEHFKKCCQKYPKFQKIVEEFENLPKCKNLKLSFYLITPAKRVMQYKMLLENYKKYLPEDSVDLENTAKALKIVSEAADHCNNSFLAGVS